MLSLPICICIDICVYLYALISLSIHMHVCVCMCVCRIQRLLFDDIKFHYARHMGADFAPKVTINTALLLLGSLLSDLYHH